MSPARIQALAAREVAVYETARQIRTLLDNARKAYGGELWDENDLDAKVIELVTEEDQS